MSRRAAASSSISFSLRFISSSSFAASSPAAVISTSAPSMSPSTGISWPYTSCSSSSMAVSPRSKPGSLDLGSEDGDAGLFGAPLMFSWAYGPRIIIGSIGPGSVVGQASSSPGGKASVGCIPASSGTFGAFSPQGKKGAFGAFVKLLNPSPSHAAGINPHSLRRSAAYSSSQRNPEASDESKRARIMASRVVVSGRIPLVRAMEKLLAAPSGSALRPAAVGGGVRGYNAGARLRHYEADEPDEVDSRRAVRERDVAVPSFFSDVFRDPFSAPQSLGRLLSLMDDVAAASSGGGARAAPLRRGWSAKEDEDALRLRVDMPGLGKEHVKVWAEQNSLVIKGEGEKESGEEAEDGAAVPRYSGRVELAGDVYRMDQIKAEMKNGVLRVVVPKVKEEQRRDVFQVNVD